MNQILSFTPPVGYYDQPFTYIYNGSGLVDGKTALNQNVRIQAGFGDFVLRRAVGWNQVIAGAAPGGRFQLQDASLNYLQTAPIFTGGGPDESLFPNGVLYPEQSQIRFDLYDVLRPAGQTVAAQVAFQGVRRVRGTLPELTQPYPFKPKPFTYILTATISTLASTLAPAQRLDKLILDYDFELEQVILLRESSASLTLLDENPGEFMTFTAVTPGPTGSSILINMFATNIPGSPLLVTVVGNTVTIQADDGFGNVASCSAVQAAVLANPAAAALVMITFNNPAAGFITGLGGTFLSGGGISAAAPPLTSLVIYDASKSFISQAPVPDIFYNGAPRSPYVNGAIVPPLVYPRSTSIRIDVSSLMTAATVQPPLGLLIHLVGKNRIPC
jgi:hypothetical protein